MRDPKILFVKQFLAVLFHDQVTTIPINNDEFKNGIQNMAEYFENHVGQFGPYVDKLDILFLKYSTRGNYEQFSKVIESFNGRVVSLENPHYVKANIKLETDYAEELLQNNELGIDTRYFKELVNCFREGAKI